MEIICNISGITDYHRPRQGIGDIKTVGFTDVTADLHRMYVGDIKNQEDFFDKCADTRLFYKAFNELANSLISSGMKLNVLKAPCLPDSTKRTDLNDVQLDLTIKTIELCGNIECKYVIAPPLAVYNEYGNWEFNKKYYSVLAETAVKNEVKILLENRCKVLGGHFVRGIFSNAEKTAEFIDDLNNKYNDEIFGFCLNSGSCNLCGQDMREFAIMFGKRIKVVVLRDNDGHNDVSLLPFTAANGGSQTDWLSLIRGLREICFDGNLIIDIFDTASAFSPILRPHLLKLAYEVAKYFKWQIEIENTLKKYKSIVLFGAGNMCRNYMKCYGEKYKPLFTCDNNSALWGTEFCGLTVKAPQELKNIPSEYAIFICNIYYREIEKQLRDIGITNPIEYFNDEYMPSFYFDRLKGV